MNNKMIVIVTFVAVVILQWLAPVSIIVDKNRVVASGNHFCFKVRPVDPSHPFTGRYLSLKFDQDHLPIKPELKYSPGMNLYLEIDTDENDFAVVKDISAVPFTHTSDYIQVTLSHWDADNIYIQYPFEQFYMEENKAKTADLRLSVLLQEPDSKICAMIKILNGASVLEDVFIDGASVTIWE